MRVVYCGVCGVPPEYCCFGPDWERCQVWITANCPELMPRADSKATAAPAASSSASASASAGGAGGPDTGSAAAEGGDVSASKAGDEEGALAGGEGGSDDDSDAGGDSDDELAALGSKGRRKQKKSAKPDPAKALILITKNERKRNKWITTITGVESFGLKIKDVARRMGKKFATGATVASCDMTGEKTIDIQGDVTATLASVLTEFYQVCVCLCTLAARRRHLPPLNPASTLTAATRGCPSCADSRRED